MLAYVLLDWMESWTAFDSKGEKYRHIIREMVKLIQAISEEN